MRPFLPPRSILAGSSLSIVAVVLACTAGGRVQPDQAGVAAVAAPVMIPPDRIERATLEPGHTLAEALASVGLEPAQRVAAVTALRSALDPRRLPAGTGLTARFSPSGRLEGIAVRGEEDRFVRVTFSDDRIEAAVRDVPIETEIVTTGGIVATSVAQALEHDPEATALVPAYADIFQWDVDLLVEPRPGDVVRVAYERRVLGAPPVDLPSLRGDAPKQGAEIGIGRIVAASYEGALARSTAYWVETAGGDGGYYGPDGTPLRKTFLKSPLNYRRISSRFSQARRNPVTRRVVPHHGVDFAADAGTPVVAAADGRVIAAGWAGPLGRCIKVRHGGGYVTVYGHLSGFARGVRTGANVRQNEVIGFVGATGRATGPHLHFTMLHDGRAIDPLKFRNPPVESLPAALRPRLENARARWDPVLTAVHPAEPGWEMAGTVPATDAGG